MVPLLFLLFVDICFNLSLHAFFALWRLFRTNNHTNSFVRVFLLEQKRYYLAVHLVLMLLLKIVDTCWLSCCTLVFSMIQSFGLVLVILLLMTGKFNPIRVILKYIRHRAKYFLLEMYSPEIWVNQVLTASNQKLNNQKPPLQRFYMLLHGAAVFSENLSWQSLMNKSLLSCGVFPGFYWTLQCIFCGLHIFTLLIMPMEVEILNLNGS